MTFVFFSFLFLNPVCQSLVFKSLWHSSLRAGSTLEGVLGFRSLLLKAAVQ